MTKFSIERLINDLPSNVKNKLDDIILEKRIKKGHWILQPRQSIQSCFYVVEGVFRSFIIKNEKEYSLDFYFKDEIIIPKGIYPNQENDEYIEALQHSIIYQLPIQRFDETKVNNDLKDLETQVIDYACWQTSTRLRAFQTMNAKERYLALLDKNPHIVQEIPLSYVASYLGINNASLSRIRSNLKMKK